MAGEGEGIRKGITHDKASGYGVGLNGAWSWGWILFWSKKRRVKALGLQREFLCWALPKHFKEFYHGVSENLTLRHTGLIALLNSMGKSVMATRAQLRRGKNPTLPPKRSILGGRGGIRPQSHALQYKVETITLSMGR